MESTTELTNDETILEKGELPAGNHGDALTSRPGMTAAEVNFAISFTQVISVLAKSAPYREVPLAHIEQFILPPLLTGQFAVMDAQIKARRVPVAVAFWAYVSPEVDRRLSITSEMAVLQPADWRSGDILWLIDIVGQTQASGQLMQELKKRIVAGREVKMRRRDANGQIVVSGVDFDESSQ